MFIYKVKTVDHRYNLWSQQHIDSMLSHEPGWDDLGSEGQQKSRKVERTELSDTPKMRNPGAEDRPEKGIRRVMWEEENLQTVVS